MHQVLVTLPSSVESIVKDLIRKRGRDHEISFNILSSDEPLPSEKVKSAISSASGYIVGLEHVDHEVIAAAPGLKVISKFGVGTDNIDIAAAGAAGVVVANCPGSNSNAVAELAIGLMIALARRIPELHRRLTEHDWSARIGFELTHKTVAILGFGNVGRRVAELLQPFRVSLLVYDAFPNHAAAAEVGARFVALDQALAASDIITVHLPLSAETRGIIDAQRLALVKPEAMLVNLARGGVVDERAVYDAVITGTLRAAAIDVFAEEPPFSSPLLTDSRIIATPHIGASTVEATISMANMAIDNVLAGIEGRAVPHPVRR